MLVDLGHHAVADHRPVGRTDVCGNTQHVASATSSRDIGGEDEHLRWDASAVEARPPQRPALHERDPELVEPLVDQDVARSGSDDDQVIAQRRRHPLTICSSQKRAHLIGPDRVGRRTTGKFGFE